jgi:hypothetical protein
MLAGTGDITDLGVGKILAVGDAIDPYPGDA